MEKVLLRDFDGANDEVRRRFVFRRLSVSETLKYFYFYFNFCLENNRDAF